MATSKGEPEAGTRMIGVGVLGYGFMGRVHSMTVHRMPQAFWPPPLTPHLVAIAGRSAEKAADAAVRFDIPRWYERWEDLVADERVELFDNTGPNHLHVEPCLAAAKAGKHILCEKPLARNATEALRMLEAARAAGVVHMCGFNYRFLPAIRLAKQVIEEGRLGRVLQFRTRYLQSSLADPAFPFRWRLNRDLAGSGVLGDLGSHIVDLARFLVGDPVKVTGWMATFFDRRPLEGDPTRFERVTTDDAFQALVEFAGGATGVLEASKVCLGSQNRLEVEVNGSEGSLRYSLEKMNELQIYLRGDEKSSLAGFRQVDVTNIGHPFAARWWPRHPLGWDQTFVHELAHMLEAIAGNGTIAPYGATFEDGYRAAVVCDAIAASAESGSRVKIAYAGVEGSR